MMLYNRFSTKYEFFESCLKFKIAIILSELDYLYYTLLLVHKIIA